MESYELRHAIDKYETLDVNTDELLIDHFLSFIS